MEQDFSVAVNYYNKAIELDPEHYEYYFNRGVAKANNKNFAEAVKDYDKCIELNPDYTEAYYSRGLSRINLNDYYDGCDDLKRAYDMGYTEAGKHINMYCKRYL